jgi:acyl dehydratase
MSSSTIRPSGWRKLVVATKNAFSQRLNEALVGEEVTGPVFSVRQGEALAYALATDDSNPAYYDKVGALASPLFASRILKDVLEAILLHPRLGMNVLKMVHAEQSFRYLRPLRVGMEVVPVARIRAVRQVSSGQILDVDVALREGGEVVLEGSSSMFLRQKTGKGGGGKKEAKEGPEMRELARFSIAADQPRRYASASHDYNPLHTKKLVARLAGFKAPIAHGLCVMAVATAKLVEHLGGKDPANLAELSVRFSKPSYPGQELTLQVTGDHPRYQFVLVNPKGKPVLSNGEVLFRK